MGRTRVALRFRSEQRSQVDRDANRVGDRHLVSPTAEAIACADIRISTSHAGPAHNPINRKLSYK